MTSELAAAPQMRPITIEIPLVVAQKMAEGYEGTLEDAALAGLKLIHGMGMPAYTKLRALAKHFETTVPRTLRTAIMTLAADAEKVAPALPKIGRPKINEERDTAVYLQVSQGATYAETANAFGLSLVRIGQIMAQQRAMRGMHNRRTAPLTTWPTTPAEAHDAEAYTSRTARADMFLEMGSGMGAAEAATKYGVTEHQAQAGFDAYRAALPEGARATKGDKARACFAGLHAMEAPAQPHTPEDQKDLSLNLSEESRPRYVMPSLAARQAQQAEPVDTRTAVERNEVDPEFGF
jgi:transposase